MDDGKGLTSSCPDCRRYVEVLNNDLEFSLAFHKQSHKCLELVNKGLDSTLAIDKGTKCKSKFCDDCKEFIEIINNDISFSAKLHAQTHKHDQVHNILNHSSSSSSSSSEKSRSDSNDETKERPSKEISSVGNLSVLEGNSECHINVKEQEQNIVEEMMDKVLSSSEDSQINRTFSWRINDTVLCSLCSCVIFQAPSHNDVEVLKQMLQLHLKEHIEVNNVTELEDKLRSQFSMKNHRTNYATTKLRYILLSKMQGFSPTQQIFFKKEMEYFLINQGTVCCSLCDFVICDEPLDDDDDIKCCHLLLLHFRGNFHTFMKKAVKEFNSSLSLHLQKKSGEKSLGKKYKKSPKMQSTTSTSNYIDQSPTSSVVNIEKIITKIITPASQEYNLIKKEEHSSLATSSKSTKRITVIEAFFDELLKNNEAIMLNAKYLILVKNEYLKCELCDILISLPAKKLETLENILMTHLTGKTHKRKVTMTGPKSNLLDQSSSSSLANPHITDESWSQVHQPAQREQPLCTIPTETTSASTFGRNGSEAQMSLPALALVPLSGRKRKILKAKLYELRQTNGTIAWNARYFEIAPEGFKCKLCNTIIVVFSDFSIFENTLMTHITGENHQNNLKEESNHFLDKEQLSNAEIQMNTPKRKVTMTGPKSIPLDQSSSSSLANPQIADESWSQVHQPAQREQPLCTIPTETKSASTLGRNGSEAQMSLPALALVPLTGWKKNFLKAKLCELRQTNGTIAWNARYFEIASEGCKCKLCNAIIVVFSDFSLFENTLMTHITGEKHQNNLQEEFNNMLDKEQLSNAEIQMNRIYLLRKDDVVYCFLCDCEICDFDIPSRFDYELFTSMLLFHLRGSDHSAKFKAVIYAK